MHLLVSEQYIDSTMHGAKTKVNFKKFTQLKVKSHYCSCICFSYPFLHFT